MKINFLTKMVTGRLPPTKRTLSHLLLERERESCWNIYHFNLFIQLYIYSLARLKKTPEYNYVVHKHWYFDDLRASDLLTVPLVTCCQIELLYLPRWNQEGDEDEVFVRRRRIYGDRDRNRDRNIANLNSSDPYETKKKYQCQTSAPLANTKKMYWRLCLCHGE